MDRGRVERALGAGTGDDSTPSIDPATLELAQRLASLPAETRAALAALLGGTSTKERS